MLFTRHHQFQSSHLPNAIHGTHRVTSCETVTSDKGFAHILDERVEDITDGDGSGLVALACQEIHICVDIFWESQTEDEHISVGTVDNYINTTTVKEEERTLNVLCGAVPLQHNTEFYPYLFKHLNT